MSAVLSAKHFHDEKAAYRWVEERVWPDGRVCPHCGVLEQSGPLKGRSTRIGVYKCYACRKPFTVKVGTIFESSHIKLHVWLQAMFLMASSKKGFSSHQLARVLGLTVKSAWFLSHRIREIMTGDGDAPFGSGGGAVEADETYIGRRPGAAIGMGHTHKMKVLALVDRDTGASRTWVIDGEITLAKVAPILHANVAREAKLMTDEGRHYRRMAFRYPMHATVNHSAGEYVRMGDREIHTNTIEGYFSVFKRGMRGVYQHCMEKHLHRYCREFDYRYSNRVKLGIDDEARFEKMFAKVTGKRLTYRPLDGEGLTN